MNQSCVIFDFDGVIADTEHIHFSAYNAALADHAGEMDMKIVLSENDYFFNYIVFEAHECFARILEDNSKTHTPELLQKLTMAKHGLYENQLAGFAEPLPGVRELLTFLENKKIPCAICSGARRCEVIQLLKVFKLYHHFEAVVTIEDVSKGKPDPEGYKLAFEMLNSKYHGKLIHQKSLVIEDSIGGITAAKAAGFRVLGVATGLPVDELQRHATYAIKSLNHLSLQQLSEWLG